jgi:hypothetical protein
MEVSRKPFAHIVMSGCPDVYASARSTFLKRKNPILDTGRRDNVLIVNNDVVVDYLNQITDDAFGLFHDDLADHYPNWKPTTSCKRFMYCHNAASNKPFIARDWHIDNGSKLLSGLWYMPHDDDDAGGDLLLKNSANGDVHRVEYKANNLILFPNLTTSWHKVDTRKPSKFNRNFINIVLESHYPMLFHDYQRDENGQDGFREVRNNYIQAAGL